MSTEAKHTPGPWSQGVTLLTSETRRWSPEDRAANDARERLMVFSGFTGLDEGRGRKLVAVFNCHEDARLGAAAPAMLDALEALCNFKRDCPCELSNEELAAWDKAFAAAAKAKGGQS